MFITITKNQLKSKIKGLKANLKTMKNVTSAIAVDMVSTIDENFEKQKAPTGEDWAEWSENTKANKRLENKSNGKILQDTGALKRSFRSTFSNKHARVYTNSVYAKTHNFGAKIKIKPITRKNPEDTKPYLKFNTAKGVVRKKKTTVKIPARPFMGISDEKEREYIEMIVKHING